MKFLKTWAGCMLVIILFLGTGIRLWGILHQNYTDENKVIAPSVYLIQGKQEPLLYPKGSYYPHFYHYVLALTFGPVALQGEPYPPVGVDLDAYTVVARVVTALTGVATIGVLFIIGKRLGGVRMGLMAALLMTFVPLHVKYSHYAHVDIPLSLVVALSLYAACRLWETGATRWYILTGLLVGLSGATHYTGLVIGTVLIMAHGWRVRLSGQWRNIWSRSFLLALLCIPIAFAIASPYTVIKWRESWDIYQQLQKRGAAGDLGYTNPHILWPLVTTTPDWGLSFTSGGFIREVHPILFAIAGAGFLVALYRRDWRILLLLGVTAVVMYVAIIGKLPLYAVKRLLPVVPFIALLAAYFLNWLWQLQWPRMQNALPVVSLSVLIGITAHSAYLNAGFNAAYQGGSTHSRAVEWAVSNLPHSSVVLQHTPIRLLDWDDARFKPIRLDEVYASFNKEDPEVSHDRAKPLSYWTQERGVDFIAMDSRLVDRYYDPTSVRLFPETTVSYQAFYDDIRARGKQVLFVEPRLWEVAGPRVEIYDVRDLKD